MQQLLLPIARLGLPFLSFADLFHPKIAPTDFGQTIRYTQSTAVGNRVFGKTQGDPRSSPVRCAGCQSSLPLRLVTPVVLVLNTHPQHVPWLISHAANRTGRLVLAPTRQPLCPQPSRRNARLHARAPRALRSQRALRSGRCCGIQVHSAIGEASRVGQSVKSPDPAFPKVPG